MTAPAVNAPADYPPVNRTEPCYFGDPERFHPIGNTPAAMIEPVIQECQGCHVRDECLAYALTHSVSGIWGATTEEVRVRYRQKHGIAAVPITLRADRQMIIRAHRRGMANDVIASLAEVDVHTIEHILSGWRREKRLARKVAS